MFKNLCVVIIAFILLSNTVEGKKTKKTKRPKEEDNNPQPDVVSYSTFGFNDVGTYEGFVPSSPDYARFLTGANDESSNKQLSSNYPTSVDTTGYGSNFGPQTFEGQSISVSNDGNSQPSYMQYQQNLNGFFNNPSFDTSGAQFKNAPSEESFGANKEDSNAPVYGTKISSKNKYKIENQFNHSDLEFNSDKNEDKYDFNSNNGQPTLDNKPSNSEISSSFLNTQSFPTMSLADFEKTASGDAHNPSKFQRVVDFTKMKPFYPTEIDTSQLPLGTPIPEVYDISAPSNNMFANVYADSNNNKPTNSIQYDMHGHNTNNEDSETNSVKSYTYSTRNKVNNYSSNTEEKSNINDSKFSSESKKKLKNKPWTSESYNSKKWKNPSPYKGYEYATNFSNMSFRYGADEPKKPLSGDSNIDELIPASSNLDFSKYQVSETDYSKFKKLPSYKVHEDNEFDSFPSYKESSPFKEKPSQLDFKQHKHLFTPESTASSYWGNSFKSTDLSSFKTHANKHYFNEANDEVVNIKPRRPSTFSSGKPYESKPQEWSQFSRRPSKTRLWNDWSKEVSSKFKSEEDLLGLRNHDTSLPSYLPSYHSSNNYLSDEHDYKKLVDKWRQSYLKSKYKESLRDYESYASEAKPMHVPVPKPYSIEVPHPIIVPVPQPYPVRVPVAKPVAVPVIREITVSIEKPVPYPVYKKVPYPIEKLVPVPVEKEVAVPVMKPYPVHVPYVRPVFHHTKTRDEYDSDVRDDDDYFPRQENKKQLQYRKKRPTYSNTRERPQDRPRRPSRVYQDRNRRRWPDGRRPSSFTESRRPSYRHRDFDEGYEEDRNEYFLHCKKTGKC